MDNMADTDGGGAFFTTTATLTNCNFTSNTAGSGGGAYFRETATLTNGVFDNNTATANGGGLFLRDGGTVLNTTFYNDTATTRGGGIYVAYSNGSDFNLQNSLLLGNGAMDSTSGHQLYVDNGEAANVVNIQHNLLAGGDTGIVYATPNAVGIMDIATVDTSDAAAVFASTTASEENYLRLKEGSSPAINVGNNDYLSPAITADLAGAIRIQGGTVDLGAYESDTKLEQMITFTLADTGTVGATLTLTETASSGLKVSYTTSNAAVAAIGTGTNAGKLVLLMEGTATITASQSGNNTYETAMPVERTILVEEAGNQPQMITFTLASDTGTVGESINLTATASSGLEVSFASSDPNIATIDGDNLMLLMEGTVNDHGFAGRQLNLRGSRRHHADHHGGGRRHSATDDHLYAGRHGHGGSEHQPHGNGKFWLGSEFFQLGPRYCSDRGGQTGAEGAGHGHHHGFAGGQRSLCGGHVRRTYHHRGSGRHSATDDHFHTCKYRRGSGGHH